MLKNFLDGLGKSGLTLLLVFVITTVLLHFAGAPPLRVYRHMFMGALGAWTKAAHVLNVWIPLTLCACGLVYAFKIDLWNIGVEGQVMLGAVCCTAILRMAAHSTIPGFWLWLAFGAGIVGGAGWALAAGFLKIKGGVHEIFAGLGLNFVAQGAVLWLIFGPWKRPGIASMSGTELFPVSLWVSYLKTFRIAPMGIGVTLTGVVVTILLINYSRLGLSFRALGSNRKAALLFGLRPHYNMVMALIFAGGFAGLAGSFQVAAVYHRLIPSISSNYGYLALLVVMLANYNPWAVPFVSLFFACLNVGSIQLPMILQLDSSVSGIIQGVFVLATLGVHAWRKTRGANFEKERWA